MSATSRAAVTPEVARRRGREGSPSRGTAYGRGVLQVVLSLAPGGTERLVVETVRRLRGRFPMAVCCLDVEGMWGQELRREGTDVFSLGRAAGFQPLLGYRLACVARLTGATVLHCHHYTPFIYGALARAVSPRLRIVFTEHGRSSDGPPSRKRQAANVLFRRTPHRVCVVSADLRQHLVREGFRPSEIDVVVNGIDPGPAAELRNRQRARALLGLGEDAFVVGTVGRLDPVKDIPTLISAFGQFASGRPDARLVVIGDGPVHAEIVELTRSAGNILVTGHRPDARELMAGFDVYVSSSAFEGISLTILEAMAVGTPVVATRVGGTPEIVVDGQTGVLVGRADPEAISQALERLWTDRNLRQAMGSAGRRRVCEVFTIDRMVNEYATMYSELGAG